MISIIIALNFEAKYDDKLPPFEFSLMIKRDQINLKVMKIMRKGIYRMILWGFSLMQYTNQNLLC